MVLGCHTHWEIARVGYDNRWDVMSDVWSNGADPIWGTMGQHTISYHKEMVEWIKPDQDVYC